MIVSCCGLYWCVCLCVSVWCGLYCLFVFVDCELSVCGRVTGFILTCLNAFWCC